MDEARHDSQLLKGVLTIILLRLIGQQETYGYELVERIHALGLTEVPDGSVYPALSRLERDGHVTSFLVRSSSGPARKYYRLSETGRQALDERRRAWLSLVEKVTPLLADSTVHHLEESHEPTTDRGRALGAHLEAAPSGHLRPAPTRDPA